MSYNHLTIEERSCIYQFLNLEMSIREIAQALKRSPSTISREIKRNSSKIKVNRTKYFPIKANDKYLDRRKDCHRKSKISKDVIDYLTAKINEHWSPEQIANRSTNVIKQVPSTSTIYIGSYMQKSCQKPAWKIWEEKENFKDQQKKEGNSTIKEELLKIDLKKYIQDKI